MTEPNHEEMVRIIGHARECLVCHCQYDSVSEAEGCLIKHMLVNYLMDSESNDDGT